MDCKRKDIPTSGLFNKPIILQFIWIPYILTMSQGYFWPWYYYHFWGYSCYKCPFSTRLSSTIHGRTGTFLVWVEILLLGCLWWFLAILGSNKRLPLPPGHLIWAPTDLNDLWHVVGGLIKLWQAHKVH